MSTFSIPKNRGLRTADNQISAVPDGGCAVADNCIQQYIHTLEPRRGQYIPGLPFGGANDRIVSGSFYLGQLIGLYGSTLTQQIGGKFVDFSGSYSALDQTQQRLKFVEMLKSIYFNASDGVRVLDSLSNQPVQAGVPKGVDGLGNSGSSKMTGAPNAGWCATNNQVGARACFGIRDANGALKLGAPSGRMLVFNPADIVVGIGGLSRGSGTLVTVTPTATQYTAWFGAIPPMPQFTLSPGEANFPAGSYTVASTNNTAPVFFTYNDGTSPGAATSTAAQTFSYGAQNISWHVIMPPGITTNHFLRLYRTFESGDAGVDPGDECFLAQELKVTPAMLTAGYVDIVDNTPSVLLGEPLYTNANTGDGILQAHERPPLAFDLAHWDNRLWTVNTRQRNRFFLSVLGPVPGNLTLTVAGVTYTSSFDFRQGVIGTVSQNIQAVAQSICDRINTGWTAPDEVPSFRASPHPTVRAYYISSPTESPGKLMFEEIGIGGPQFSVYTTYQAGFFPALTTTAMGALVSDNSTKPNDVHFSVDGQPDAVPITNSIPVGQPNKSIVRGVALRNKMFVFVDDDIDNVWTISGAAGRYRVDIFDGSARLICPDSAVVHSNQILAFTMQGVVSVSDSGVRILSKGIEDLLLPLLTPTMLPLVKQYGFGVSYESDRQYLLFLPTVATDTVATQAFVYNSLLDSWCRWPIARTWAKVNPATNLLTLADAASNNVRLERKTYTREDYKDESFGTTLVSATGTAVTVSSVAGATVGDLLYQDDAHQSIITAIDTVNSIFTVADTVPWTGPSLQVFLAIPVSATYCPMTAQAPSIVKHFRQASLHLSQLQCETTFKMTFDTERQSAQGQVPVPLALALPGFNQVPFGRGIFGSPSGIKNVVAEVTMAHQEATQLRIGIATREARAYWRLNGFSCQYDVVGDSDQGGST